LSFHLLTGFVVCTVLSVAQTQNPDKTPDRNPAKPGALSDAELLGSGLESLSQMKVVTASKFSQDIAKAPGVMTVVSKDELRRMNVSTLYELLSRVTGFTFTASQFTDRTMLAARGEQNLQTGGHILFLINGRPTREVLEGGFISDLLESFPVNTLERVEVIRGPGSVLYGSNAISAVVNLITRAVTANSLTLRGSGGTGGVVNGSMEATARIGRLSALIGGQFRENSGWNPLVGISGFQPSIEDVSERRQSLLADIAYRGLRFQAAYLDYAGPYILRGVAGRSQATRAFGDLGYAFHVAGPWESTVNLTYTRTTFVSNNFLALDRDSREAQVEWGNSVDITKADHLAFGVLVRDTKGLEVLNLPGGFQATATRGEQASGAIYLQWEREITSNVAVIGGLQSNKIAGLDWNLSPRFGLIWSPAVHWSVRGLYSSAFRAPSLDENNIRTPQLLGDPNLRPERAETTDAGVFYQSRSLLAGVNYFHTKLLDAIVQNTVIFPLRYQNSARAAFQGVELEAKFYLTREWLLSGSLLYQTGSNANNGNGISPTPAWSPKGGLSYRRANGLSFDAFDQYSGSLAGYLNPENPIPGAFQMLSADLRCPVWRTGSSPRNVTTPVFFIHGSNLTDHSIWLPFANGQNSVPFQRGRVVSFGLEFAAAGKGNL
jgi:outer membrane receptor for ferrienterochelin and colicins